MLLVLALIGFVVPNSFLIVWLLTEYRGLGSVLGDRLALGFILDLVLTLALLSVYFARRPIGRFRWPWFVALTVIGGLSFSLPLYTWLNRGGAGGRAPDAGPKP